ncbi:MAG TPA: aspartate--tRNA ligase [Acholeplasmataceae bacterium]|nr:MAG: aspartate--tRNA ligase [Tenericutes bacterium GWA2_38_26]OHE30253.1 MAG: aspartate--tRNA ligase [Tenericutes bacterium GWC2_39_45]OHE32749.1 MAG: aspartate--tRNA ligase [Tenericutes bacterium GWD2_38_27]OHE37704.1 MAG: aspartate--tRNA ligase [Tenericutes bacterium GWE2_38_8]OHE40999.1 MAG: aspartate--tRNA ligase [Tenericutes bacterium GWF2_38_8]HBG33649.1 aspartate--tRNA ligase [Acholeplasmataceae bacterium]
MKYTHHNNELNIKNIGQEVYLKGWAAKVRNLGGLIFIDLRDRFGLTQLVVKPENPFYDIALKIRNEFVLEAQGKVIERENKNKNINTGEIEVEVSKLTILNTAENPPIIVSDDTDALEDTRLKYRYLDLRRPVMQNFLIKRHQITQAIRSVLVDEGFYELETPILGKSTPEGARDYLVPSRIFPGTFYALPQSPQIYKQLFMVAGMEKYFQVARCFRDEDLRADRQPEFTQIDIEQSFVDQEDIIPLVEKVLVKTFKKVLNVDVPQPFARMSYQKALELYGSDKPDMRYEMLISDYTYLNQIELPLFNGKDAIRGITLENGSTITRKRIDQLALLVKKNHGEALAYIKYSENQYTGSVAKFLSEEQLNSLKLKENNMLFIVPGQFSNVSSALGALRIELANEFKMIQDQVYKFLWVVDWPLLEYNEEENSFSAMHHPFTSPVDAEVLRNNPKDAMAKAYDIVLNGYEIGGGSIRIHNQEVQRLMFDTLGLTEADITNRFGFFVDALKYGTPPHGGLALGLDRVVMLMTGTTNIKDVVAFPKTQSAKDMMMQAPSDVDQKQLDELNIKVGK